MTNYSALLACCLLAASCSTPVGLLDQPSMNPPGPTCDQQVDALISAPTPAGLMPAFGYGSPTLISQIDGQMANFLVSNGWPGGSLSITYQGHLVFARAYGYGDPTIGMYTEPDSLFRLASVSNPITAMAILKMIHDGQLAPDGTTLTPDSTPFSFLNVGLPFGCPGCPPFSTISPLATDGLSNGTSPYPNINDETEERFLGSGGENPLLTQITVNDLLYHAGGWNRALVDDPGMSGMVLPIQAALGLSGPANTPQNIQFMLNQPLQFKPGKQQQYSNIGFWVLGEVINESSVGGFDNYLATNIYGPLGMNETGEAYTLKSYQRDREVSYFSYDDVYGTQTPPNNWVFNGPLLPIPYAGGGWIEGYVGGGSLLSSAIDLARFNSAIRDGNLATIFPPAPPGCVGNSYQCGAWPDQYYSLSSAQFPATASPGATCYYGMGWDAIACGATGDPSWNWYKTGGFGGTSTEILLTKNGFTITALFNASGPNGNTVPLLHGIYETILADAPSTDIFPAFGNAYTKWMDETTFDLALAGSSYPARVDGHWVPAFTTYPKCTPQQLKDDVCPPPIVHAAHAEYRARMAPIVTGTPSVKIDRDCGQIAGDIAAATAAGQQVVSLQKFQDASSNWRYQAVFASPPM